MAAVAAAAAASAARARRMIIAALRGQGAVSPSTAAPLPEHRGRGQMLRRLIREGVVIEAGDGRYYIDEAGLAAMEARLARFRAIALPIVATLLLVMLAVGLGLYFMAHV